ncbi:DUF2986 family protein [Sinobacterium caligoides]|uniref:DUF2986 family protein n=1 Tax=Sinobacterium caligoides TaxID=933926 RepID=A0A3N2DQJ5_9GAMM|nr:DUF2986 domain-containing protein [Sinobacterium caligoides]ROS01575.1 DUF2986 family protein [Sinobacterium caligoides]
MNRRKKLKQIIKRKDARGKAAQNSNKPKYISKADRLKLEVVEPKSSDEPV